MAKKRSEISRFVSFLLIIGRKTNLETVKILKGHIKSKMALCWKNIVQMMKNKGYKTTYPVVGETYTIGGAAFTIIAPNKEYGNDMNSWSVGVLLQNGNHRFLFTGDAEEGAEQDILQNGIDISADVYKVAHHGSNTATSQAFLDAVHPTYAVISAGEGNSYGHPHAETLERLAKWGVSLYNTKDRGAVSMYTDGRKYGIQSP